ncbi:MAG: nucleotidyltransferase family protein [Chloroflexi bacterium]|nr:nucleotidyltransferase family protein [Chloroflexota bacterium]
MNTLIAAVPDSEITRFCQRWRIHELALFGSALRSDFGPNSDLDVLVTFSPEAEWGLLEHVQMQQELQSLFHRKVDLITKRALERSRNWLLRREILNTAETLFPRRKVTYAAG